MHASVTVHMDAPSDEVWNVVSDVRNTGKFSPEVFEAEWLGGQLRTRRNKRDMTKTLNRVKAVVEGA
ncbi:hypothetical protein BH10ACT9_BH10ACT9_01130 [soil metagenome]